MVKPITSFYKHIKSCQSRKPKRALAVQGVRAHRVNILTINRFRNRESFNIMLVSLSYRNSDIFLNTTLLVFRTSHIARTNQQHSLRNGTSQLLVYKQKTQIWNVTLVIFSGRILILTHRRFSWRPAISSVVSPTFYCLCIYMTIYYPLFHYNSDI